MSEKKQRKLKVYGQSGYKYRDTPTIILKGKWLTEAGFEIGDPIDVGRILRTFKIKKNVEVTDNGKIII